MAQRNLKANPRCVACDGKGVIRTYVGWRPCACTKGTRSDRALTQAVNRVGGREYKSPFGEGK